MFEEAVPAVTQTMLRELGKVSSNPFSHSCSGSASCVLLTSPVGFPSCTTSCGLACAQLQRGVLVARLCGQLCLRAMC